MSSPSHIIKRLVVELVVPEEGLAPRLQEEAGRIFRQRLLPLIDRYCSRLSRPDLVHRIERMELDLGHIALDQFEAELVARFEEALRSELADLERREATLKPEHVRQTSHWELFTGFIEQGVLPWWADATLPDLPGQSAAYLARHAPDELRAYLLGLRADASLLKRLLLNLRDETLHHLAALLAPPGAPSAPRLHQDFARLWAVRARDLAAPPPAHRLRLALWTALFLSLNPRTAAVPMAQDVVIHLALEARMTATALADTLRLAIDALAEEGYRVAPETAEAIDALASSRPLPLSPPSGQAQATPTDPRTRQTTFSDADEIFVDNAGLVILWPFLLRFFEVADLVEDRTFINMEAAQRGVFLLQYLVDPSAEIFEYMVPLPKVLCGVDGQEPYLTGQTLTEEEAGGCEAFLSAVIAQAPILGEMSVAGFRGSFLFRKGILSARDGHWLLRVERKTYDVVLDRFPWSFNVVKLPWMDALLQVVW